MTTTIPCSSCGRDRTECRPVDNPFLSCCHTCAANDGDTHQSARRRRPGMCSGCPFNPNRDWPPVDADVMATIWTRIRAGEHWICHQTCDGARETPRSLFCAGVTS